MMQPVMPIASTALARLHHDCNQYDWGVPRPQAQGLESMMPRGGELRTNRRLDPGGYPMRTQGQMVGVRPFADSLGTEISVLVKG